MVLIDWILARIHLPAYAVAVGILTTLIRHLPKSRYNGVNPDLIVPHRSTNPRPWFGTSQDS